MADKTGIEEDRPTTIWIKQNTKLLLDNLGNKGETYDDILNRLILQAKHGKSLFPFMIDPTKHYYRQGVEARPYFVSAPYFRIFEKFEKGKPAFALFYDSKNQSFWETETTIRKAREIICSHLADGKYLNNMIKEWEDLVEQQKKVETKIKNAENLEKKKDKEIILLLKEIFIPFYDSWKIGINIELFDPDSEGIIMEILDKYDKTSLGLNNFKILCSPEILTNIQNETISIYTIAEKDKKDEKEIKKLLDEHAKRFFWIKNTWADAIELDAKFFKAKVAHLKDERIDFEKEKQKITDSLKKLKQDKERIRKNYPKLSVEVERAIQFFELMTEWREKRKKYALITNHFLKLLLEEIAKRARVQKELLYFASALELDIPLERKFVEELQERRKFCMIYAENGEKKFATGKEAEEFAAQFQNRKQAETEVLYGNVANPGKVEGTATIIFTTNDLPKMKKGDILVAPCTRPEYVPAMKKASAILTDEGGITSHAAIVSRELGVPCIVGLHNATDAIKDGDFLFVNANHGVVQIKKRV